MENEQEQNEIIEPAAIEPAAKEFGEPTIIGCLELALNESNAKLAEALKFIADLSNDNFALSPSARERAQEFLARMA